MIELAKSHPAVKLVPSTDGIEHFTDLEKAKELVKDLQLWSRRTDSPVRIDIWRVEDIEHMRSDVRIYWQSHHTFLITDEWMLYDRENKNYLSESLGF